MAGATHDQSNARFSMQLVPHVIVNPRIPRVIINAVGICWLQVNAHHSSINGIMHSCSPSHTRGFHYSEGVKWARHGFVSSSNRKWCCCVLLNPARQRSLRLRLGAFVAGVFTQGWCCIPIDIGHCTHERAQVCAHARTHTRRCVHTVTRVGRQNATVCVCV